MWLSEYETLARILRVGHAADPGPEPLLDKSRLARIRVRQLDTVIEGLKAELDIAQLEQKMLKEEYKF